MSVAFDLAIRTSQGKRPYQEDYCEFIISDDPAAAPSAAEPCHSANRFVAVLADGMGGHAGGAVASRLAVEGFRAHYLFTANGGIGQQLESALQAGNAAIARKQSEDPALDGMGCTLIGAHFDNATMRWVSVGDSLILLYRGGELQRLNADHSQGAELDRMAEREEITIEQARSDPMRHALRSAVTGHPLTLVDRRPDAYPLHPGDWIIIASDGLETLGRRDIRQKIDATAAAGGGAEILAQGLICAVEAAGKPYQDNTTVMVVHLPTEGVRPSAQTAWHPSMRSLALISALGLAFVLLIGTVWWVGNGVSETPRLDGDRHVGEGPS